ncbi:hypothetical protein AYK24_04775 [Thermoplasmatales archaeon SG8-52-4]|nr:MAG: hypothetical protein AYK24_04775 [Thermoplasmatales archaeon SG8-52-4]
MLDNKSVYNPWTLEDENEHPNCLLEWWCIEAFFKTNKDNNKWTFKGNFSEWFEKPNGIGSISNFVLYNNDTKKFYVSDIRDGENRLKSSDKTFDIKFRGSYIKGEFPKYEMLFINKSEDIELLIKYNAKSYPHWIAQDITNGTLPVGFGYYRYGFIPRGDLSGELKIKNKKYTISGDGYYEHVWGDFTYHKIVANIKGLKKSISIYAKLIGQWLCNNKIEIPKKLKFLTENSPFGYDWAWVLLDNGWSIFYGNLMFWLMEGPATGILILTKDGKAYEEWFNIKSKYNKTQKAKKLDFHYPTEFEINAKKGKEKIFMKFKMTAEPREYFSKFLNGINYFDGISIIEAPGIVEGYYDNGKKRSKLTGICKIEPQRQVSKSGHNKLELDILKPPEGFGLSLDLDSNIFKKKMFFKFHILPKPKLNFCFKKLD